MRLLGGFCPTVPYSVYVVEIDNGLWTRSTFTAGSTLIIMVTLSLGYTMPADLLYCYSCYIITYNYFLLGENPPKPLMDFSYSCASQYIQEDKVIAKDFFGKKLPPIPQLSWPIRRVFFKIHTVQQNRSELLMQNNVGLGAIFAEKVFKMLLQWCLMRRE
jgi:hypothetical protein